MRAPRTSTRHAVNGAAAPQHDDVYDVAICGAGPAGLATAAECAARGVVVLRCCDPREVGHEAFLMAAEAAFGRRFRGGFLNEEGRELRAVLLLA